MAASRCLAAALAALLALAACQQAMGCIEAYGSVKEGQERAGGHFTYSYNGLDWVNDFEACRGAKQSPIMLPGVGAAAQSLPRAESKTTFSYGTLANPTVLNNGHTLIVSLPDGFQSNVLIPIKGDRKTAKATSIITGTGPVTGTVKATPAQFHFHTHAEHVVSGAAYPLELHIVHFVKPDQLPSCPQGGCPVVLGVMLALGEESEVRPELKQLIEAMPLNEKESATIKGNIDLNNLLPANRTYFIYEGSLTAPPCTEGLLWHVLATPIKISQRLLTRFQEAVGDAMCGGANTVQESANALFKQPSADSNGCHKLANGHNWRVVQPLNGRTVKLAV